MFRDLQPRVEELAFRACCLGFRCWAALRSLFQLHVQNDTVGSLLKEREVRMARTAMVQGLGFRVSGLRV